MYGYKKTEYVIELNGVNKEFKVLNRHEGLKGSFRDLFSRDYRIVNAVNHVSVKIKLREIVWYPGSNGAGFSSMLPIRFGCLAQANILTRVRDHSHK